MIPIKTPKEIEAMQKGGRILAETIRELEAVLKPGMTESELDKIAEELIIKKGGEPGFKKVPGYDYTLCVSTNDVVVHGLPTSYAFKEGDLVGIDCGVYYEGFFTDMAETLRLLSGQAINNEEVEEFLEVGKRALNEAIKVAKPGNRIWHISKTIQDIVEGAGYSIVKTLVGHGVGRQLHEEPEIPGFVWEGLGDSPILKPGMTLAIEVIYNMGKHDVTRDKDKWTIRTKDGSLSSTFERTIAITEEKALVLTK
jgi:methionyl aminopeptidase